MAKQSKKKEDETNEVVANCDHPDEVIANCETPQETSLSQYDIEKLIVTVRGEQVLIDQDIARIYGVTTGRLNQQAKRNIARFPESFRFQLTKEERDEVIANCDNLRSLKFYPSLPYAYTEQGIGRWMSLKSTIEYLGEWEMLYNPNFNCTEFDTIRNAAGSNNFVLSVKAWIERTGAIGIMAKAGRYGGTYRRAEPNAPVKDYICEKCKAQYLIMYNTQINKEWLHNF